MTVGAAAEGDGARGVGDGVGVQEVVGAAVNVGDGLGPPAGPTRLPNAAPAMATAAIQAIG